MARLRPAVFGVLVALGMLPAPGDAQARRCRQVLPSDFRRIVNPQGEEVIYFRDPVRFDCTGNVLLEADSAVMNRGASTVELVGHVTYRDSTRELRSEWANYLGRMDQLLARDDVVLRDLEGGAVIRGDQLNYLRETDERPMARMIVTGERPSAVIPRRPETGQRAPPGPAPELGDRALDPDPRAAGDTAAAPMHVEADRLELEGEDVFRAQGDVDLERGDMMGRGQTAFFDQAAERMTLTGSASVWNESYRLDGERIDAFLEGDGLREVRSERSARLTSEELNVSSEQLRIGFADGELERLEAWNPEVAEGAPRARAEARDFRLRADSIDARADSLGIREVRAVGRAYGERDVTDDPATAGRADLPAAIARDWIQGDTILGFFSHRPVEPDSVDGDVAGRDTVSLDTVAVAATPFGTPDTTSGDTTRAVLERIVAVGGSAPALSLYRMAADEGGGIAMNFMKASRIILFMEQGEVERVEAEGPIEGLYLDPSGQDVGAAAGDGGPGGTGRGTGGNAQGR